MVLKLVSLTGGYCTWSINRTRMVLKRVLPRRKLVQITALIEPGWYWNLIREYSINEHFCALIEPGWYWNYLEKLYYHDLKALIEPGWYWNAFTFNHAFWMSCCINRTRMVLKPIIIKQRARGAKALIEPGWYCMFFLKKFYVRTRQALIEPGWYWNSENIT